MIDTITHQALTVLMPGKEWPYIVLPAEQLDLVTALLREHNIPFEADDEVLSIDGKPEVGFISLGRTCDPKVVQAILDGVP